MIVWNLGLRVSMWWLLFLNMKLSYTQFLSFSFLFFLIFFHLVYINLFLLGKRILSVEAHRRECLIAIDLYICCIVLIKKVFWIGHFVLLVVNMCTTLKDNIKIHKIIRWSPVYYSSYCELNNCQSAKRTTKKKQHLLTENIS